MILKFINKDHVIFSHQKQLSGKSLALIFKIQLKSRFCNKKSQDHHTCTYWLGEKAKKLHLPVGESAACNDIMKTYI